MTSVSVRLVSLIALLLSGCSDLPARLYAVGGGSGGYYYPAPNYVAQQQANEQFLWQQQMMEQAQPRRMTICNTFPGQVQCY